MNLQTMTPAEVDQLLAPLATKLAELQARRWYALDAARDYERKARGSRNERLAASYTEKAATKRAEAEEFIPQIEAADTACEPFRAEFERRGGWSRIYWCTANGGHAHRSLSCSTLRITTGMVWLPDLSGTDEAALVEMAGESACTICYPSAPVDVLARPSSLAPAVADREAAAARKKAKDDEKAERARIAAEKGITNPDGSELRGRWGVIKTERTAQTEYVDAAADALALASGLTSWGAGRADLVEQYTAQAEAILPALAHKRGTTVEEQRAALARKVHAKAQKQWSICLPKPTA